MESLIKATNLRSSGRMTNRRKGEWRQTVIKEHRSLLCMRRSFIPIIINSHDPFCFIGIIAHRAPITTANSPTRAYRENQQNFERTHVQFFRVRETMTSISNLQSLWQLSYLVQKEKVARDKYRQLFHNMGGGIREYNNLEQGSIRC